MADVLTIEAHGASYQIEDPGGLMAEALRAGHPYEVKMLEHVYRQGFKGTALDVGASVGNHSLWLAAVCGLTVIAAEPLDFERLALNLDRNADLQVQLWPFALGATTDGRASVTGPPAHVVGTDLANGEVPVTTLDALADDLDELALIKIDVEGMEPEVLRGARETIRRFHPRLYVEAVDVAAHRRNAGEIPRGYQHTKTFGSTPLEEWTWTR